MSNNATFLAPKDRLILALDTSDLDEARSLHDELNEHVGIFKVGLQLLTKYGPEALKYFQNTNSKIFLDGKFHDIPNTVAKASQEATELKVAMFTIHACGGKSMMKAALEASINHAKKLQIEAPLILAVSVLTSISQNMLNEELLIPGKIEEYVLNLARLATESGITGLVASPEELILLRKNLANKLTIITPGIRPSWSESNDQSRFTTPSEAIQNGADYLVIGRPISQAKSPKDAAKRISDEIDKALAQL